MARKPKPGTKAFGERSEARAKKLREGYPLGRKGERVTPKPPQTKRATKRQDPGEAMRKYDAETIQEKNRVAKEIGLR